MKLQDSPSYQIAKEQKTIFTLHLTNWITREIRIDWYSDICIDNIAIDWETNEQRKYIEWYIECLCSMWLIANYDDYESEAITKKILFKIYRNITKEY